MTYENFNVWCITSSLQAKRVSLCILVLFTDKPGPPEGPLVVDEVFADSCKLSWKPPLDDGNAPVSGKT